MIIDETLAKNKIGDQISLNSQKTTKKSLKIKPKITTFGAEANKSVTLVKAPS
jgi:hypothetical protein|tara:strand:+ start:7488 stop:7646 length:159 start_codon:yes stop_codon:yes gene_type:complete